MRRALITALFGTAIAAATPAHAALTLVGTLSGNQCTGAGGINSCYATTTGTVVQTNPGTAGSSPLIARIEAGESADVSTLFPTISGNEFTISFTDGATNQLQFTYNPGAGDPVIHYIGLFNGGGAASGTGTGFNNTYQLFYDPNGITSATFNLSTYFANRGWSHLDVFDTGAVPEAATWTMMLLGFGGIGMTMRRRRRVALPQLA